MYSDSVIFFSAVCNDNKWRTIQDAFKVAAEKPEEFVFLYRYHLLSPVRTLLQEIIDLFRDFEKQLEQLIRDFLEQRAQIIEDLNEIS